MTQTHENLNHNKTYTCGRIKSGRWTPGHPLPVEGCLIMSCERGEAEFSINSRSFAMKRGDIAFIVFDMVVVPTYVSADFETRFFSAGFDEAQDMFFLVTSNRFWDFIYKTPVFRIPYELKGAVTHWFALLEWAETECRESVKERLMRNEAENFISAMAEQIENRLGMLGANPSKNRAWTLVNDFVGLLDRHYAAHHDVAFYAAMLNITPNYLNIITRRNMGTTAKEQIHIQIGLVMKMLLDTTDLSVKQIAARLHYDDPSYLCRIFRKQTGMSPIQYRNRETGQSR